MIVGMIVLNNHEALNLNPSSGKLHLTRGKLYAMYAWHHNLVEGHMLGTDFEDVLGTRVEGLGSRIRVWGF